MASTMSAAALSMTQFRRKDLMMNRLWTVPAALFLAVGVAAAQTPAAQAPAPAAAPQPVGLAEGLKRAWAGVKLNVTETADKMPEANYGFKPTPEVRSFGEVLGHIANGNMTYCSLAKGEAPPKADAEKIAGKADLVKALNDSFATCDAVFSTITDESLLEKVKNGQRETARGVYIAAVIAHVNEHYGNLVTYMRLKGMVPPSTERAQKATSAAPKKPSQN
jgi:uncharacterized damage-inducible protein DinB